MGNAESASEESFSDGLLEYPQYTRPQEFEGRAVPNVLNSGNHSEISRWRQTQAEALTRSLRPDLWKAWALGTGAALLAILGTPAHWDTFRLLFGVMAAIGAIGTVLHLAPKYLLPAVSALLLFHFTGIFLA